MLLFVLAFGGKGAVCVFLIGFGAGGVFFRVALACDCFSWWLVVSNFVVFEFACLVCIRFRFAWFCCFPLCCYV